MTFTYKAYIFHKDLETLNIEIIEKKDMDMGAIVTFTCNDEATLDKIFAEEKVLSMNIKR